MYVYCVSFSKGFPQIIILKSCEKTRKGFVKETRKTVCAEDRMYVCLYTHIYG